MQRLKLEVKRESVKILLGCTGLGTLLGLDRSHCVPGQLRFLAQWRRDLHAQLLTGHQPSVDGVNSSGDPPGLVRREEQGIVRDVFGLADATERVHFSQLGVASDDLTPTGDWDGRFARRPCEARDIEWLGRSTEGGRRPATMLMILAVDGGRGRFWT